MNKTKHLTDLSKKLLAIKISSRPNKQDEYKRTVFYTLKDMGGVYVKFLQTLSIQRNFMKGWSGPKELTVFDQVDFEPFNIRNQVISPSSFLWIDETPFAAGSFAQVFRAQLITGEHVVIKALRPSIINNLDSDLRFIKKIVKLLNAFLPNTLLDFNSATNEFCKNCRLETDYNLEIQNTNYFYNFYKNSPDVVTPRVYESLSNDRVIVQDFIPGPTFADALTAKTKDKSASQIIKESTGSNLWAQLTLAGGEFLKMACSADYVFGDPHPGNIKLLPDNKIGFIDFGIIAEKPTSQMAFYNWVKEYQNILNGYQKLDRLLATTFTCFCPDTALAFKNCIITTSNSEQTSALDTIVNALDSKMDFVKDSDTAKDLFNNGHLFQLFSSVLDNKNSLGIKIDPANFQLLKATQSFLSSINTLDFSEGHTHFANTMRGAMTYCLQSIDESSINDDTISSCKYSDTESYEIVMDTISSLASGDQFLFKQIIAKM